MAEASLVDQIWPDVTEVRRLLEGLDPRPLTEAMFVDEEGDWRVVAVLPDVELTGTRPIYRALDEAAAAGGVDFSLLSRIVVLDAADRAAQALAYGPVSSITPPRRLEVTIPALPGYAGAILQRDDRLNRRRLERQIYEEVAAALHSDGIELEREVALSHAWRPDFVVPLDHVGRVAVEVVVSYAKNLRNRIEEIAGRANLVAEPAIVVWTTVDRRLPRLNESYGFVPVIPVNWEQNGVERLREAIVEAKEWSEARLSEVPERELEGRAGIFELFRDKSGRYRFRLKAPNGRVLYNSATYISKAAALNGIESARRNTLTAHVVDET